MQACNEHKWNIEKTEYKPIWLPPNSEGQRLSSMKIHTHLKCDNCSNTKMHRFFMEQDIQLLYESHKDLYEAHKLQNETNKENT